MAISTTRVATNFTSYTSSGTALYVYTGSLDGGHDATLSSTGRLYYNHGAGGTVGVFWLTNGQKVTSNLSEYNQLVKITGLSSKPTITRKAYGTTTVSSISTSATKNILYLALYTLYSHQNPGGMSYSITCPNASKTEINHGNASWSMNGMASIVPTANTTITLSTASGSSNEPRYSYILEAKVSYTATLNTSTEGGGTGGTVTGGGTYTEGTSVVAKATANTGYRFIGWYNGSTLLSNSASYTFTLSSNVTYTAKFIKTPKLTLIADGNGSVSGGGTYDYNTNVTIQATADSGYGFDGWYKNGSLISTLTSTTYKLTEDTTIHGVFGVLYDVVVDKNMNGGTVTGAGTYLQGKTVSLTNSTYAGYLLDGWYLNDVLVGNNNSYSFVIDDDYNFLIKYLYQHNITLIYDEELGSATVTREATNGNRVSLEATLNDEVQFKGWYVNGNKISTSLSGSYVFSETSETVEDTIEAVFERIYTINASTDGNGAIDYTRQSTDENIVTFTVIPNEHHYFTYYTVNGVSYTENPLTLTLNEDVSVVAYFEQYEQYFLNVVTNIAQASVYVSVDSGYGAFTSTLWARPFPDYTFVRWSDGVTENPRDLNIDEDTTIEAIYQKIPDNNGIYQYRCFVKDQLNLTDRPKAFMIIDTFNLKVDKLTKSTSSFTVYEMPSNINNGDILVVYDPTGRSLYNGVINSIEEKTIRTSNMESFYKGQWIYNTHYSTYLEEEIGWLLEQYAQGIIYNSTYTDPLVAQRLGGISIRTSGDNFSPSITAHLPTDLDKDGNELLTQKDMETFIYELYEKYNIIFDFTINFVGENYVDIKVPNYTKMKIGNNMFGIQNMSPITTIEETNRLIIFSKNKVYRRTYIATKNNIVSEPTTTANRFNITNTKIVFSDDDYADLVANNLPTMMYNHKLSFDLVIKNFVYQFGDFNLGGELDIYDGDDYYDSVLTGYEIQKLNNQNITSVHFVCGKIRTKLTQLLTLSKV